MAKEDTVTRKIIWDTLKVVDVNKNKVSQGKLTFLSWNWAWTTLMQYFPNSTYQFLEDMIYPDGSMEVRVVLTVEDFQYYMWLAVMDYRHNSILQPSATHINKARMRCLTKAIAMAGLGFYIYAGEDLPEKSDITSAGPAVTVPIMANPGSTTEAAAQEVSTVG